MATVSQWNPFGVSLNITATAGTVTRTSATKYTVVINASWECYWDNTKTNYGMTASSGGASKTINTFGTKSHSGSGSFTGTYSISGNGSASKTVTVTFKNFNTDNGDSATKTVSFSVTVPAWTSYKVSYNANGGSGAPSAQTKWKDQTLTLSSTKPTRTGYTFSKWNTASGGTGTSYSAGGSYTANAAATLYAQWTANKYTITFNANGGTGGPTTQTKTYGVTLTLSTSKPTRTNYTFKGWSTSKTATTATYAAGASFTTNANTTLYAVWALAYAKPKITSFSVDRCNSSGTASDEGTYGIVKFNWSTTNSVSSIKITWNLSGSSTTSSATVSASGTSGSVSQVFGGGALSVDGTYDVTVTVTDSGGSTPKTGTINGAVFPFDAMSGNKGVSFGGPAVMEGYADVYYNLNARGDVVFGTNDKIIYGTKPDGSLADALCPANKNGNTVLGYGNYTAKSGNTNIYGYDLNFGIANIASPGNYRPYRRHGDTITIQFSTAGYVTNSKKEVTFYAPMTIPIIGSPTVTITSNNGFTLRQNNAYTHGSSASVPVIPASITCGANWANGIRITATFSDTTNAINNAPIGIVASIIITFS